MRTTSVLVSLVALTQAVALPNVKRSISNPYLHVAAFSVDGLHASDIDKYLAIRPNSTIAALLSTGYRYPNANTTAPSDSFPGSVAQYTGGSPRTAGVWYDVTYDRSFYAINDSTCTGFQGTEVASDESIDYNSTELFSGGIDPANLVYYIAPNGTCQPLYPHNRVRVNTAFEVVVAHGLETAYTDKHPAYDIMRGPSGTGLTTGYFPEIAAIGPTVNDTIAYDQMHVDAFLDWLDAKVPAHSEGTLTKIPTLFGGNFQSVSVAQKTVGYENTTGNPFSPAIIQALDFVDSSLGQVVAKMKSVGIFEDTLVIVASKHGQSPINSMLKKDIDPDLVQNSTGVPVLYNTADDISMLFLNNTWDTYRAVENLKANMSEDSIYQIYSQTVNGLSLRDNGFGSPLNDPAVPDILIAPDHGVIYTTNTAKFSEHGGISNDDRNVACFLSSPRLKAAVIYDHVDTTQIGPVIMEALGYNTTELEAVVKQGTAPLPGPVYVW